MKRNLNNVYKRRRNLHKHLRTDIIAREMLKVGDVVYNTAELMIMQDDGDLIKVLDINTKLEFVGRKHNPCSNLEDWYQFKVIDEDFTGLINPIAIIGCLIKGE